MKIFSTASMAAFLLGAGAIMHSGIVKAEIPDCPTLAMECNQGNQEACHLYQIGCKGEKSTGSISTSTSPDQSSHKPDAVLRNSKKSVSAPK